MNHKIFGHRMLVRIDLGEKVITTLTTFCRDHEISCASLTAIGAVEKVELAYYNLRTKMYETRSFPENCELVSLSGNVALVDGAPFIHAHASLSRQDYSLIGGHLVEATVAGTVEVFLDPCAAKIERVYDEVTGLKLIR